MDALSKTDILERIFNVSNVLDFKRLDLLCREPEDKELLGFAEGKMIFKNDIDNSVNSCTEGTAIEPQDAQNISTVEGNSDETQHSKHQISIKEDSPKAPSSVNDSERPSNSVNNSDKQEGNKQKIVLAADGKRFLFLNGKRLQIVKHATSTVSTTVNNTLSKRLPTLFPKIVTKDNKSSKPVHTPAKQPSMVYIKSTQQNVKMPGRKTVTILPKFNGKLVSIDKSKCPPNLSNIMKEVGGTIRLVNSVNSKNPGNPLLKYVSSSTPVHSSSVELPTTVQGPNQGTMESSQCSCKNKQNLTSVSTNTEQLKVVDKEVQTEPAFQKQVTRDHQPLSPLGELYSSDVIIGDDVNMGHGPPGIFVANERKMKIKFVQDLKSCLKWDSGRLPIHKAVMDQDIQAVKAQCVILKIRKSGVNIPDSNNYTPLQLTIIHNVNIEIVKILLEYKADMSVLDMEGNNILHLAVEYNRNDLVKIFLEKIEESGLDINHFNYEGVTPLMMCALLNDRIDMAEHLLKNKAELNLKDRKSGRSAIFHAAVSHNAPMVLLLLDYGADTKIRNFFGTSVHDAMFELDDIPNEIKYPILGRDLKINEKRKLNLQDKKLDKMIQQDKTDSRPDTFKRKKLEIVSTIQKLESKAMFIVNHGSVKK